MAIFEILLVTVSLLLLVLLISKIQVKKQVLLIIISATVLIFILHFIFNVSRWQFYPIYISVPIILGLLYIRKIKQIGSRKLYLVTVNTFLTILIVVSLISVLAFPMYEIPVPSGDYLIGTTSFVIEDPSREELYSDEEYRRFKIQLWYPAETVEGKELAPWLEGGNILSRALAKDNFLPGFALDHTVHISSNSYYDAPINETFEDYPIVVISHGWRGFRTLHTDFAEELASIGYIVVSIDHTYGSVATVFDDDDYAYLNLDALPPREENPDFLDDAYQLVDTYAEDIINTLDFLEELNVDSNSLFYEHLNVDKIGLLGHSTGGGAGVNVALRDDRVKAVFGLDSWVEPNGLTNLSEGLSVPSEFLRSGSWETGENNQYLYTVIENSTYPSKLYQIDGTTHYDFAMVYMYSPLTKYIGFTGSVESEELTLILKDVISDFFDHTLNESDAIQIDPSIYEEVREVIIE
jgi:pimeloyl-ACP methyl ester carboxylesterase